MELKKDNRAWTVSRSLHSLAELRSSSGLEYAFLSPIFDSISKQGYKAAFEEEKLRQALADNSVPVIALGGLDLGFVLPQTIHLSSILLLYIGILP